MISSVLVLTVASLLRPSLGNPDAVNGCLCPTVIFPVCGTDGQTYQHLCALECQLKSGRNVRFAAPGPCAKDAANYLPGGPNICTCPLIYKPVCASNGGTYGSNCVLECENKLKGRKLKVHKQGPCALPYYVKWLKKDRV